MDAAFLASFNYDPGTPTDPIVFNVSTLNPGGYCNTSSGNYTVPLDGVYEFMFHIWGLQDSGYDAYLAVDGVQVLSFSRHQFYIRRFREHFRKSPVK